MTLTQNGAAITGTLPLPEEPAGFVLAGTVRGKTLSLRARPAEDGFDDCHIFSIDVTFEFNGTTLTATGANGVLCEGDGAGGHASLVPISSASGTLTRA